MKLLLDNGLPRGTIALLADQKIQAVHVGDIGMVAASDQSILDHTVAEVRVIVTLDADFHSLLATSGANAPSVIRIRREGLKAPEMTSIIVRVLATFSDELRLGAAISVELRKARCHRLPLG